MMRLFAVSVNDNLMTNPGFPQVFDVLESITYEEQTCKTCE